jgi:hypothetical protein
MSSCMLAWHPDASDRHGRDSLGPRDVPGVHCGRERTLHSGQGELCCASPLYANGMLTRPSVSFIRFEAPRCFPDFPNQTLNIWTDFNCNSFTNDCIGFLTGGSIPSWIKGLCGLAPAPIPVSGSRRPSQIYHKTSYPLHLAQVSRARSVCVDSWFDVALIIFSAPSHNR